MAHLRTVPSIIFSSIARFYHPTSQSDTHQPEVSLVRISPITNYPYPILLLKKNLKKYLLSVSNDLQTYITVLVFLQEYILNQGYYQEYKSNLKPLFEACL